MKVFIGPAGIPEECKKFGTIKGLECVRDLNLNAIELQFVRKVYLSQEKAKEIERLNRKLNLYISIHAPYYINFNAKDKGKLERSIKYLYDSVKICRDFAKIVVFHPGSCMKDTREVAYINIKKNLIKVIELLENEKIKIILGVETLGKKRQFGKFEEVIRLCNELREEINSKYVKVNPVIDFAHLHCWKKFKSVDDFLRIFKVLEDNNYLFHFHFSCIECTEKGEKRHLPLEAKEPDYSLLVDAIEEFKPKEVALISETPIPINGALKMRELLVERFGEEIFG